MADDPSGPFELLDRMIADLTRHQTHSEWHILATMSGDGGKIRLAP